MNSVNFNALNNSNLSVSKEQKRKKHLGVAIVATTVGTGVTALALGAGFTRNGRANINKFYNYLVKKSEELSKIPAYTKGQQYTKDAVNLGKSVAESTRSVMNFISLKDILFKKITDPIPGLGKACQAITDFFERVAIKTTENSYLRTSKNFDKMYEAFETANQKVSKNTAKKSKVSLNALKSLFNKNFSQNEIQNRISKTKQGFQSLDEEFWGKSFKDFKTLTKDKNTYSSFIAEKMMAGKKSKLFTDVLNSKSSITFSHEDDIASLRKLSENIKGLIDPFGKESRPILDNIRVNLDLFEKKQSQLAKKAIVDDMKKLTSFIEDKNVANQFKKSIDALPKTQNGKLQELLEMYKGELSEKDYKILEKQVNKAIKSLEKSTALESDNLFDKMRDLKIGSAPTDMLTLLTTFSTVGIGLAHAKDSDERKSAALKFGIPAVGTVLTTMYGTLKMFTAGQSLIFGAAAGLIINKIGEAADNLRLQAKGKKNNNEMLVTPPTIQQVTDAVVDNTIILSDAKQIANGTNFLINTVGDATNTLKTHIQNSKDTQNKA